MLLTILLTNGVKDGKFIIKTEKYGDYETYGKRGKPMKRVYGNYYVEDDDEDDDEDFPEWYKKFRADWDKRNK